MSANLCLIQLSLQQTCKFMSNSIKIATNLQQTCIAFQKSKQVRGEISFEIAQSIPQWKPSFN